MTQPTVIFFGPDKARPGEHTAPPKVYLRTLLFATSKRGRIIESMHVSLSRSETHQNFNVWVYGDSTGKLVRGSGLFVGESGVATDHHFLTPEDGRHFTFSAGHYRLAVYIKLLGDKAPLVLFSQQLEVTGDSAAQLSTPGTGLYFDWGPDSADYLPHVEQRRPVELPQELAALLGRPPSE